MGARCEKLTNSGDIIGVGGDWSGVSRWFRRAGSDFGEVLVVLVAEKWFRSCRNGGWDPKGGLLYDFGCLAIRFAIRLVYG